MTSNYDSETVVNKTFFSPINTETKNQDPAEVKPKLQPPLADNNDEWEGFYDDNEYEEF